MEMLRGGEGGAEISCVCSGALKTRCEVRERAYNLGIELRA